jgi:hypothetical protein
VLRAYSTLVHLVTQTGTSVVAKTRAYHGEDKNRGKRPKRFVKEGQREADTGVQSASLEIIGYTVPSQKQQAGGWQIKCTIGLTERQWRWGMTAHRMAILGLVALTVMGVCLESVGGWEAMGQPGIGWGEVRRGKRRYPLGMFAWKVGGYWLRQSWEVAALRSGILMALVLMNGKEEWEWACVLPWAAWLWKGVGIMWPLPQLAP